MLTIQLGHPKINTVPAQEFEQVKEVFLQLFHTAEESIYLYWNTIPIRFRYKEDLYQSFDDILAMSWFLQKESTGKTKATLTNQLMTMDLEFYWKDDELKIVGRFAAFEPLYEGYAQALNRVAELQVSKRWFLAEWKTVLHQLLVSFDTGNIIIKDGKERRKLELLQQVENRIEDYGALYRA